MKPAENVVEYRNIGTEENPKIVKLSKNFPVKEKEEYVNLMKRYTNVFAWIYEDLKEYDTIDVFVTSECIHLCILCIVT